MTSDGLEKNDPDIDWKLKKETYEEYCARHAKRGTTPLNKIKWQRMVVEGHRPFLH